jgi:hypothetical protein
MEETDLILVSGKTKTLIHDNEETGNNIRIDKKHKNL